MASPGTSKVAAPPLPRVVDGFRLLRELGRGGMGVVYHAEEISSGRVVALKVLAAGADVSEEAFERFRRESRMAASISDSRCVFVYGAHQVEGAPAIAMELCPGETLEHRMAKGKPIEIETAVRWTLEILEGLEAAHRAGVVHRDVKPSNCFITHDDHVKVGDFGLSRSLDTDIRLTQSGAFLGSPLYASPEQIKGREVDRRSDIYSCGATLYALLAGRAPYQGTNIGEVLARILSESPPPLRTLRPDVPVELERVVARAMERDPEKRFRDHASFRDALDPFVPQDVVPGARALRIIAFLLDEALMSLVGTVSVFVSASARWAWLEMDPERPGRYKSAAVTMALSAVPALYFGLCEGLAGATAAKWVFGLRVVDVRTRRPDFLRGLLRACVFFGPGIAFFTWNARQPLSQEVFGLRTVLASVTMNLLFASSMRRRNGFRGLHELASGTRVVQARSPFARSQESRPVPVHASSAAEGWPSDLGSYRIEGTLGPTPAGTLLLGVDESLSRPVWIHAREHSSGAASEDRRSLARPGRLRWLDAIRRGETLFEVFEAPGGASLSACVAQGASFDWASSRRVLAGLADELAHASDACLEQVWIDRAWNPRLLDEPVGAGRSARKPPLELLSDAARLLLVESGHPEASLHPGLPTSAEPVVRKLLGRGAPFASLEDARRELTELARRPMRLTSFTRALQMGVSGVAPALVLFVVTLSMFAMSEPIDHFVESVHCIRQIQAQDADPPPAERMDEDDRRAREIVISDAPTHPWVPIMNSKLEAPELEVVRSATKSHPAPSAEEMAWARARIRARPFKAQKTDATPADPVTTQVGPLTQVSVSPDAPEGIGKARWVVIPIFVAWTFGVWGFLGTILAFAFRGGLSIRLFGLGVRDRRGEMASRLRCCGRSLLVWLPLLLLYGTGAWLAANDQVAAGLACTILGVLIHALALAYAIWRPSRSLQDRLAGTHLVSR